MLGNCRSTGDGWTDRISDAERSPMNANVKMTEGYQQVRERVRLLLLICVHILVCCATFVVVARYDYILGSNPPTVYVFHPPNFHIFYDPIRLYVAVPLMAAFAVISFLFVIARFSFGYFAGFYLYMMMLGYLWLDCFSDLSYDHALAGLSAAASIIAFLLPTLFISSPLRRGFTLSTRAFDRLLILFLLLGVLTIGVGAIYSFRIVALADMYHFRDKISAPPVVNYFVAMISNALLPFAFAGSIARKAYWQAAAVLLILPLFYPITLTKVAFFTPIWLVAMLLLSRIFAGRAAVVVSLLAPAVAGLILLLLFKSSAAFFFYTINFRLVTIPSLAMDIYNDFFSRHDLTYFCQISVLKPVTHCPYQEQLSVLMEQVYGLGNYNASSFATEGIASVGPLFAPVTALIYGLVVGLGNRLSAGLPASFILISGSIFPQILLNVPLSTAFLTHGMGIMFLLWYLTPRAIFERTPLPLKPATSQLNPRTTSAEGQSSPPAAAM